MEVKVRKAANGAESTLYECICIRFTYLESVAIWFVASKRGVIRQG